MSAASDRPGERPRGSTGPRGSGAKRTSAAGPAPREGERCCSAGRERRLRDRSVGWAAEECGCSRVASVGRGYDPGVFRFALTSGSSETLAATPKEQHTADGFGTECATELRVERARMTIEEVVRKVLLDEHADVIREAAWRRRCRDRPRGASFHRLRGTSQRSSAPRRPEPRSVRPRPTPRYGT
jgi:hypothetical protein